MLTYLDACAIIEAREKDTDAGEALANLMIDAFEVGTMLRTCELSLLEVLVGPLQNAHLSDQQAQSESRALRDWYMRNIVSDGRFLKTLPVNTAVLTTAASLRADAKRDQSGSLKTPDAIHFAAALEAGCGCFITGDERLAHAISRHEAGSRLNVVALDEPAITALSKRIII